MKGVVKWNFAQEDPWIEYDPHRGGYCTNDGFVKVLPFGSAR